MYLFTIFCYQKSSEYVVSRSSWQSFHPWRSRGAPSLWRASPPGIESSGPPPPGENISNIVLQIFSSISTAFLAVWALIFWRSFTKTAISWAFLSASLLQCESHQFLSLTQSGSLHLCSTQFLPFRVTSFNVNSSVTRVSSSFVLTLTAEINLLNAVNCLEDQLYVDV